MPDFAGFWLGLKNNAIPLSIMTAIFCAVVAALTLYISWKQGKANKKIAQEANTIANNALEQSEAGNKLSQEANEIAQRALDTSEKAFAFENRPYIEINSHEHADGGIFYTIEYHQEGFVRIWFEMVLVNKGKLAANDFFYSVLGKYTDIRTNATRQSIPARAPKRFSLAPGQSHFQKLVVDFPDAPLYPKDRLAKAAIEAYEASIKKSGLDVHFTVEYKSEADNETTIRTWKQYKIFKDSAWVTASGMPTPVED